MKVEIDWDTIHRLTTLYHEHIQGNCEYFTYEHGTNIKYDKINGFVDDRCEEQILISNNIVERVYPYLSILADHLLKGIFKMSTPNGPIFLRIRKGSDINTIEDLAQEGSIGVIKSLKNYDPEKKRNHTTRENHIINFIRCNAAGAMTSSAYNKTLIRIPTWFQSKKVTWESKGRDAAIAMMGEGGFVDNNYSSKGAYNGVRSNVVSIDELAFRDSKKGNWQERYLSDEILANPEEQLGIKLCEQKIKELLDTFPEKERGVIRMRFGFNGREYTLKEIGEIYEFTGERIRQIEKKVLKGLSKLYRAKYLKPFHSS